MRDDKNFFGNEDHEHEVGVAVNEQSESGSSKKPGDDYFFSSHEEGASVEPGDESEEEKNHLAYAQSSKERLIDKVKGNAIYIFIALILIIPGSMKLYNMLVGTGPEQPAETGQNVNFTSEKTATTTPEENQPVEKSSTEENAIRSLLTNTLSIGGGSKEESGNITKEEKAQPATKTTSGAAAEVLAGNEKGNEILDRYFTQESKVEQQLTDLLGKMDDIEARLATLNDLDKRLTELENTSSTEVSTQLGQLVNRVGQIEQNMNQMRQQAQKATAAAAAAPPAAANISTSGGNAQGISVEAVIPGRAWVRTPDGVLMVVEVGDEIPGVGKVTRIDAREGIVATTTQVFKQ